MSQNDEKSGAAESAATRPRSVYLVWTFEDDQLPDRKNIGVFGSETAAWDFVRSNEREYSCGLSVAALPWLDTESGGADSHGKHKRAKLDA